MPSILPGRRRGDAPPFGPAKPSLSDGLGPNKAELALRDNKKRGFRLSISS